MPLFSQLGLNIDVFQIILKCFLSLTLLMTDPMMHKQLILSLPDLCCDSDAAAETIRAAVNRGDGWIVTGGGAVGDEWVLSLEARQGRIVPDYHLFRMTDLDKRTLLSEISRLFYDGFSVISLLNAGDNRWVLTARLPMNPKD